MKIYSNSKKDHEIISINDWREHCAPKGKDKQWKPKRSAMEMANYWLDADRQKKFLSFIQTYIPKIIFEHAIPEHPTKFDDYSSARQNDLVIYAIDDTKKILITIEGKADESYGNLVINELNIGLKELQKRPLSKKLERVNGLISRFGDIDSFKDMRYQLFTWLAGTLSEAKREGISDVILISQEFHSDKTTQPNIDRNSRDLNRLVNILSKQTIIEVKKNEICAPFVLEDIRCHLGKLVTNI